MTQFSEPITDEDKYFIEEFNELMEYMLARSRAYQSIIANLEGEVLRNIQDGASIEGPREEIEKMRVKFKTCGAIRLTVEDLAKRVGLPSERNLLDQQLRDILSGNSREDDGPTGLVDPSKLPDLEN